MRKLTVSATFRYVNAQHKAVYVPLVRLQGKWLEALGFTAGAQVHIEGQPGELTIRLVPGGEQT